MPIIPKLNLKAAVKATNAGLNLASTLSPQNVPKSDSTSDETPSIEPTDISLSLDSGQNLTATNDRQLSDNVSEQSSPTSSKFDYDDDMHGNEFKTPPGDDNDYRSNNDNNKNNNNNNNSQILTSFIANADIVESTENPNVVVIDNNNVDDVSLQSFSDVDSVSEHSVHSEVSYTKEALQIVAKISDKKAARGVGDTISEPSSPASSSDAPIGGSQRMPTPFVPRKRRRTIQKLSDDPNMLPLCDLLFYNPPPTIFQTKAQEDMNNNTTTTSATSVGNKNTETVTLLKKSPSKRRGRSSRTNSVASESSNTSFAALPPKSDDDDENTRMTKIDGGGGGGGDENSQQDVVHADEPLLTLDERGNIIIKNPSSLSSVNDKKSAAKMKSSTTYNSFRRRERSKNIWNTEDTGTFYTALEIVGTDFSLMEAVFFKDSGRNRKQLKQKFKREEKINRDYIDSILYKSLRNRSKLSDRFLSITKLPDGDVEPSPDAPAVVNVEDTTTSPPTDSAVLQTV